MNLITTRRSFLAQTATAAGLAALPRQVCAAAPFPFRMGAQSYSFRKFDTAGALTRLKEVGLDNIEFCAVHFPPAKEHEGFSDVQKLIAESGVNVLCFGVESFGGDRESNRIKFEFAKALGLEVLTADPSPNSFDQLDELTEEFDVKIAIHNHGPRARYDSVEDTLRAVEGRNPRIGACVDSGHVIRSGEKPHEVIQALGARVHSMHLKDWIHGGEEQILGEGDIDLEAVARELKALDFNGPLMLEFELSPEDPVPGMKQGLANWKQAVAGVYA